MELFWDGHLWLDMYGLDRHIVDKFTFMKQVYRSNSKDKDLHVILDNLSAHKTAEVKAWLENKLHIHFQFVPISSSWLSAVEV